MRKFRTSRRHQRGFAIAAILGAIALAAAVAVAYATASQSSGSLTGQQTSKTQAASIITVGTNLSTAWQAMQIRSYGMTDITFKGAPGYAASDAVETDKQMFHPTAGATSPPTTPAASQDSPGANDVWHFWTSNIKVTSAGGTDLGTNANDGVAVLPKLKLGVCQHINNQLFGDALTVTPLTGNIALADLEQIAPGSALTVYSIAGATTPRTEACLATTDGSYFYVKVLQAQ